MKIMIVEDNDAMSEKIMEVVHTAGDELFRCSTSSAVLGTFEQHKPDVVLMDIRIKPLNGVKTTKMLKHIHPEARVIMLTSHDEPEYHEAARLAGAAGYMLKENLYKLRRFLEIICSPVRWMPVNT